MDKSWVTIIADHRRNPGLASLHAWKESIQWTHKIKAYITMSRFDKAELKKQ